MVTNYLYNIVEIYEDISHSETRVSSYPVEVIEFIWLLLEVVFIEKLSEFFFRFVEIVENFIH